MALSPIEDRYLSALTAAQFPDMPASEPAMPVEPGAMESSVDGMVLAAGPSQTVSDAGAGRGSYAGFDVRQDVANKGAQPEMRAYDPTTRERIASFLQAGFEGLGMNRVKARQNAQTLIGGPSSNLPLDMGIADIVPFLGTGLQTEEAVRMGGEAVESAKAGNIGTAALQAGGAALGLVPGAAGTVKAAMAVGRAGERLAEKTVPEIMAKGGTMAELLQALSQGSRSQLTAYHGTPHQFDKFDASKIGTGEGNQTFGFGLYFAENKDVAKGYQSALSGYSADGKRLPSDIGVVISHFGGDVNAAIAERQRQLDKWMASGASEKDPVVKGLNEEIQKLSALQGKKLESTGSLYTVDIPDEMVSKMLDFEAPFNKQPKSVQEAIKASGILKDYKANLSDFSSPMMTRNKNMRGENIMQFLEFKLGGQEQVAARLQELGIPGVRYLDAGSRDSGKGTRNIVVFPGGEDQIKILKQEGKK